MDQAILERITSLLRRDLKLSPTTPINEGTALFGGEMDLDSIDILLVLTSLEREFGIQLTSDKVSKSAFQSVATLVAFVEQSKRSGTPSAHDAAAPDGGPPDAASSDAAALDAATADGASSDAGTAPDALEPTDDAPSEDAASEPDAA